MSFIGVDLIEVIQTKIFFLYFPTVRVRQIQEKLEEFINALNQEK